MQQSREHARITEGSLLPRPKNSHCLSLPLPNISLTLTHTLTDNSSHEACAPRWSSCDDRCFLSFRFRGGGKYYAGSRRRWIHFCGHHGCRLLRESRPCCSVSRHNARLSYVNVTAATGILLWCHFRVASHVFLAITVRALHGQTECPLWSSLMGESRIMYLFRQVFVQVQKPGWHRKIM